MSEEFATVVLKELREFRTETNQKFDSLGGKVDVLQTEVTELKKLSNEHTKAINKLQEVTEEIQEEIAENTNEIYGLKHERDKKTMVDVLEAIKLNSERVKLCNMRIARLEEWKDNFENGLISMV